MSCILPFKTRVEEENLAALRKALATINGLAEANVATAAQAIGVVHRAEGMLNASGIPVNERKGVFVTWCAAGPWAKSYRFRMTRTRFFLTRGSRHWFLAGGELCGVYPRQPEMFELHISREQRERIVSKALQHFRLRDLDAT